MGHCHATGWVNCEFSKGSSLKLTEESCLGFEISRMEGEIEFLNLVNNLLPEKKKEEEITCVNKVFSFTDSIASELSQSRGSGEME